MKHDIFISYRRDGGTFQAQALKAELEKKNYSVFMDTYKLKGGDFKKKLENTIRESCNFVVIISLGCFDQKKDGEDVFLKEISLALKFGKNLIPIYYDNVTYEDIKEKLSEVYDFPNQNAITFHNDDPIGTYNRIISFLKTEEEVLKERFASLSKDRDAIRQDLILLMNEDDRELKCPVCTAMYSATMSYCQTCGYKFFDELEKSVANKNTLIQERERCKKHRELWQFCCQKEQIKNYADGVEETEPQKVNQERIFTVRETSFKMILVKGDTFMMGAPNSDREAYPKEKPQHIVTLNNYYICETVVTQALWKAVMGSNPSNEEGDELPVEKVSWNDAQEFIKKINVITGCNFRLPTEAEWEFAARSGKKDDVDRYSGSDIIDEVAWYWDNSGCRTHPVKLKKANELGLYDMSGNVWEWCEDLYNDNYYSNSPQNNPQGPSSGNGHVVRGGSCNDSARLCRVLSRDSADSTYCNYRLGFRLALPC